MQKSESLKQSNPITPMLCRCHCETNPAVARGTAPHPLPYATGLHPQSPFTRPPAETPFGRRACPCSEYSSLMPLAPRVHCSEQKQGVETKPKCCDCDVGADAGCFANTSVAPYPCPYPCLLGVDGTLNRLDSKRRPVVTHQNRALGGKFHIQECRWQAKRRGALAPAQSGSTEEESVGVVEDQYDADEDAR